MSNIMDFDKIEKQAKRTALIRNIVIYGLLGVWALIVLFPFYWMLLTSVKTQGSYASEIVPKLFTLSPTTENYVQVFYLEGERVRDYLVRASMRSIEELCADNGLKRCHRSFYLNPAHVKTLRREKEGVIVAELDVAGQEVPVTKRYYDDLVAIL